MHTERMPNEAPDALALRRLRAAKQKGDMIAGIAELSHLPAELNAPVSAPGRRTSS